MTELEFVTILHISDLQFGPKHRFHDDAGSLDEQCESLRQSLETDLTYLKKNHHISPEVVIVSGDLAEQGKKEELKVAFEFLDNISKFLHLPHSNFAIVPGNHDINRDLCAGYFQTCLGRDEKPQKPYWPKWEHYVSEFNKFYQVSQSNEIRTINFSIDNPWSIFPIEKYGVVIAGLNSTIAESHLDNDHYGYLGDRQCKMIADLLRNYREDRWFRIGVLHHNIHSKDIGDEESLRDVDALQVNLSLTLNMILHGHAHQTNRSALIAGIPIYSTGSAAVMDEALPQYTPNQYQLLQITSNCIRRYTRCYLPEFRLFAPDTRGSENKQDWISEDPIILRDVSINDLRSGKNPSFGVSITRRSNLGKEESPQEIFLGLVEDTCRCRNSDAVVQRKAFFNYGLYYLQVTHRISDIIHSYPVMAVDHLPQPDELDCFTNEIVNYYRSHDPWLTGEVVYGGNDALSKEVCDRAEQLNLKLYSLIEYQGLIDFRKYLDRQKKELYSISEYRDSLYVPQALEFEEAGKLKTADDAISQIMHWMNEPHARFILILGEFGTGKTFLLRQLTKKLSQPGSRVIPLFIELRTLEKARSLDELIVSHLARMGEADIHTTKVRHMLSQGRLALIFDGFDELTTRVSYDRALEHFDTLLEGVSDEAKIIVTSRTSHFENENQVRNKLAENAMHMGPALRYCKLQIFNGERIIQFLTKRIDDVIISNLWFELIRDVKDLLGLAQYPRMLSFITDLDRRELEKARAREGKITAASLYKKIIVEKWLGHEYNRLSPKGIEPILTEEQRLKAITHFAFMIWNRTDRTASLSELDQETTKLLGVIAPDKTTQANIALHQIGSGTLLIRDEEGRFSFAHQSIMEWLISNCISNDLLLTGESRTIQEVDLTKLMAEFLIGLQPDLVDKWISKILSSEYIYSERQKRNALLLQERVQANIETRNLSKKISLETQMVNIKPANRVSFSERKKQAEEEAIEKPIKIDPLISAIETQGAPFIPDVDSGRAVKASPRIELAGHDLRDIDFTHINLQNANLRETNLNYVKLSHKDLSGANLENAQLIGTDLTDTDLTGARLDNSDLSRASLMGANLNGASLKNCIARRAKLVSSQLDEKMLNTVDIYGAALPSNNKITPFFSFTKSIIHSIAWHYDNILFATGHRNGVIHIWDAVNIHGIRLVEGHIGRVTSMSFSFDGKQIASGGVDGTVRIWDVQSGKSIFVLEGHNEPVYTVSCSPSRQQIASGDSAGNIFIWNAQNGKLIRKRKRDECEVNCIEFSPDGKTLVCGYDNGVISQWDVNSGKSHHRVDVKEGPINRVAYRPDGSIIASWGEGELGIWDPHHGENIKKIKGEYEYQYIVAFNMTNRTIARVRKGEEIEIWDMDNGKLLRGLIKTKSRVSCLAFSPDGRSIIIGDDLGNMFISDTQSGKYHVPDYQNNIVQTVAFGPDGLIAGSCGPNSICLWDIHNGHQLMRIKQPALTSSFCDISFSPDGGTIAIATSDGNIRIENVNSEKVVVRKVIKIHKGRISKVGFIKDGRIIISYGYDDHTIRKWDLLKGKEIQRKVFPSQVICFAYSPDGRLIAGGSYLGIVHIYNMENGKQLHEIKAHVNHGVFSVAFNQDGTQIVTGSGIGTICVWEVQSGKRLQIFEGYKCQVSTVIFSHDGKNILSGGADHSIRIWDINTGKELTRLDGHKDGVLSIAISNDGKWLVSGGEDQSMILWNLESGNINTIYGNTPGGWVIFTPEGRYRSKDQIRGHFWHTIKLCRFEPGELDKYLPDLKLKDEEITRK